MVEQNVQANGQPRPISRWTPPRCRSRESRSNAGSGSLSGFQSSLAGTLTPLGNTPTDKGTVDAAATPDGHYLYVQTGAAGIVDEFSVNPDGSLTSIGSITVPNAVGGEGIVAA